MVIWLHCLCIKPFFFMFVLLWVLTRYQYQIVYSRERKSTVVNQWSICICNLSDSTILTYLFIKNSRSSRPKMVLPEAGTPNAIDHFPSVELFQKNGELRWISYFICFLPITHSVQVVWNLWNIFENIARELRMTDDQRGIVVIWRERWTIGKKPEQVLSL